MTQDGEAVARSLWDAYLAGDVEAALRHFAPDAEWHAANDFPGPQRFKGHDELRLVLDTADRFPKRHVAVNEITDLGGFVLAHGVVHVEEHGEAVIDRVTAWRFRVAGDLIVSVEVEALPALRP